VTSLDAFARELRGFDNRRAVTRQVRRRITRPVRPIRKAIADRAVATLPSENGLGRWVARTRVTASVSFGGRRSGVRLVGKRKSSKSNSDVRAINRGRVRAPSWGRRGAGDWHVQSVTPGFFTVPAGDVETWRSEIAAAVDDALRELRG